MGPKLKKTLPNNILGIQHTNTIQELVEWYSAADVLFNPTYEDNYPTINLEAQACGTPVISYRTGGSPESIPVENVIDIGDWKRLLHMDYGKLRISNVLTSKSEMVNQYLRLYREK